MNSPNPIQDRKRVRKQARKLSSIFGKRAYLAAAASGK